MPDETDKLQQQPAEGSRKVIERELERQATKPADKKPEAEKQDEKHQAPSQRSP